MKNSLAILLAGILLAGCHKNEDKTVQVPLPTLALFKVNYLTHHIEGFASFHFTAPGPAADSIPLSIAYVPPGDFGSITLRYAPSGDTVFNGSIIWNGNGTLHYPAFGTVSSADYSIYPTLPPDSNQVQQIRNDGYSAPLPDSVIHQNWGAVQMLTLVQKMVNAGARTGIYLYTPGVGVGNPADWHYIWMFYLNPANP